MQLKTKTKKKEIEEGHLLSFLLIQQPYVLPSQIFIFLLSYINPDINNLPARFTFLDNTWQSIKQLLLSPTCLWYIFLYTVEYRDL